MTEQNIHQIIPMKIWGFQEKGCIQRWLESLKEIEDQALLKEGVIMTD